MFLISAEVSGNTTEAVRSPTGKEPEKMMRILAAINNKIKNMKYFKNIELVTKENAYQKMKKQTKKTAFAVYNRLHR